MLMGLPVENRRCTIQEYLERELKAMDRHEYLDGQIVTKPGESDVHSFIVVNIVSELGRALRGQPCSVAEGNLRVRTHGARYVYPDASVICGEREYDPADPNQHTVLNPRVIVEVLSPTTEAYDRGDKFEYYQGIKSLEEYVLIAQDRPAVQSFLRQADGTWSLMGFNGVDATLRLRSLAIAIPFAEIYYRIAFPERPPQAVGG
jgi:Uma2 family endonuclease